MNKKLKNMLALEPDFWQCFLGLLYILIVLFFHTFFGEIFSIILGNYFFIFSIILGTSIKEINACLFFFL